MYDITIRPYLLRFSFVGSFVRSFFYDDFNNIDIPCQPNATIFLSVRWLLLYVLTCPFQAWIPNPVSILQFLFFFSFFFFFTCLAADFSLLLICLRMCVCMWVFCINGYVFACLSKFSNHRVNGIEQTKWKGKKGSIAHSFELVKGFGHPLEFKTFSLFLYRE